MRSRLTLAMLATLTVGSALLPVAILALFGITVLGWYSYFAAVTLAAVLWLRASRSAYRLDGRIDWPFTLATLGLLLLASSIVPAAVIGASR